MSVLQIDLPDYDPGVGLIFPIVPGGLIEAAKQSQEFVIRANPNGLKLIAFQLLTLAQDGVPEGSHLHFDPGAALEDGSSRFVVERLGPGI